MLKTEEAQARLREMKADKWVDQRLASIGKLPETSRTTARAMLGREASGKPMDWQKRHKAREQSIQLFRRMSTAERQKLFEAIFGDLAPYVRRGWEMLASLPYETGYGRKPFRAPHTAEVIDLRRATWVANLCESLEGYAGQRDVTWVAAWAPHLPSGYPDELGLLLAAAIDAGGPTGQKVLEVLKDSAAGQHEIGHMGRHVTRALLNCGNPDAWDFVGKLLLAAQRQEGLRQTILETIDEAHPQAFRRMLKLILDNDLIRFAATVRAVDVWFGFQWDAASTKVVGEVITKVLLYLDDAQARQQALDGKDAEEAFLSLWCSAFEDASATIPLAARMLKDKREGKRFVAAHTLYMLGLDQAREAALPALEDPDLRVVARAMDCYSDVARADDFADRTDLFERLEKLLARTPETKSPMKPIVWPWWRITLCKEEVATVMHAAIGDRPVTRLVPYLEHMKGYGRAAVVGELVKARKFDADTRELLLRLVGDNQCREAAISGLEKCRIRDDEVQRMEMLLTRRNGDLRRGLLGLLEGQNDAAILCSADRLLGARDALQRLAGLEMLRRLVEGHRLVEPARQRAATYQSQRGQVTSEEANHLQAILDEQREAETLDDALGLLDASERTAPAEPKKHPVTFCTPAAREILRSLDALVDEHREQTVSIPDWRWGDEDEDSAITATDKAGDAAEAVEAKPKGRHEPLGNVKWDFPSPLAKLDAQKDLARLPLRDVWESWWRQRPAAMRDSDGLEVLRALWLKQFAGQEGEVEPEDDDRTPWLDKIRSAMLGGIKPAKTRYGSVVGGLLTWVLRIEPPPGAADFLLDGFETALAIIPKDKLAEEDTAWDDEPVVVCNWREHSQPIRQWEQLLQRHAALCSVHWRPEDRVRYYRLLRWCDEPTGNRSKLEIWRDRPNWSHVLAAFKGVGATEADLIDQLLGPRGSDRFSNGARFGDLGDLTTAKPPRDFADVPALAQIVERCRQRIIDVELKRGDSPTAATAPALSLRCSGGLDTLARVLAVFGKDKLCRSRYSVYGDRGRAAVFSHLIRVSNPGESDTPQAFARRMSQVEVDEARFIEVAMYAPQWAGHIEQALAWPGLEDAVWWIHAHTRDAHWGVEEEIRNKWEAAVRQRTPLAGRDLMEGAVDVAWFHRAHQTLGVRRWAPLYDAAKYASSAGGHSRARLFADAMLGRERKNELIRRIREKRNQDVVRALGLLPLPGVQADGNVVMSDPARKDLHERYKILQEFIRTSRQFGSQRQASEKRAAAIGIQNLARTAGYPDPQRLQWAMEAEDTRDLAHGPVVIKTGDIAVSLSIDEEGRPQVLAQNTKTQRALSAVPPAARKSPKVAALLERKTDLRRSVSRVRQSLEQAMCRGDVFSGVELRALFANPMLSPLLGRTVFVGEGILGYPRDGGQGLEDFAGKIEPVKKQEQLRIAHPVDLLNTGNWDQWQHDCFARERVQPFKQVFRELYVLTKTERDEGDLSRRYAGHQINPRQAMALLTSRSWVAAPEQGVFRTFHDIGLSAWLTFQESFFTPADVEGLTLEGVRFAKLGHWKPLALADVPQRIFSEVMRDVDLVVSVAHRGGVDPEASASTVEMRAALLRETCELLKLTNVRIKDSHVLVEGDLARYSVHLGSAVTHRQPGGALFIVAVHSQHRGRLFLPFADDDPKTAAVISKVLLLARDREIQDPNLLAQIRA